MYLSGWATSFLPCETIICSKNVSNLLAWYNGTMSSEVSIPNDAGKGELATADNSLGLEKYFRELIALGVWQLSLVSCGLFTVILALILALIIDTTSSFLCVIAVGMQSWIASFVVWVVLSQFRWPVALRLIFALWLSVYLAIKPVYDLALGTDFASFWPMLGSFFTITTFILPALATGTVALLPYVCREHLNRKEIARDG